MSPKDTILSINNQNKQTNKQKIFTDNIKCIKNHPMTPSLKQLSIKDPLFGMKFASHQKKP